MGVYSRVGAYLNKYSTKEYLLWFNFILGSNFIFLCLKLIVLYYHPLNQREIKFKQRIKLNHNIATPQH